jgi:hypothetical protein
MTRERNQRQKTLPCQADVASTHEAVEWAKRVPAVRGSKIEVRRVVESDEVSQDDERIVTERAGRERSGPI